MTSCQPWLLVCLLARLEKDQELSGHFGGKGDFGPPFTEQPNERGRKSPYVQMMLLGSAGRGILRVQSARQGSRAGQSIVPDPGISGPVDVCPLEVVSCRRLYFKNCRDRGHEKRDEMAASF